MTHKLAAAALKANGYHLYASHYHGECPYSAHSCPPLPDVIIFYETMVTGNKRERARNANALSMAKALPVIQEHKALRFCP